jgi:3',5'-cyclic-AMP phosphodiesterase
MPIHLSPISRRRFLSTALTAGASVLTWRGVLGADTARDADRWALLADTHIAADPETVHRGVKMAANLERAVAEVIALDPKPAGVVLNGDAAFLKGAAGDYAFLAELLKPVSAADIPIHFTLGNHDHREHSRKGLLRGAARSPLVSRHVAVIESNRANWFLLDSLDVVNVSPGLLGKKQLAWLATALDARPGKPALVVVHHNPQSPLPEKPSCLLDTEQLNEVLVPRKQVKALIFGHTHQWRRDRHEGIHLINLPPVAYLFDRNKESPNGWVDLRLRDGGGDLALHAFDPKHPQAGQRIELTWR